MPANRSDMRFEKVTEKRAEGETNTVTVSEVAELVGGTVVGDGAVRITGVAGIKEAKEGEITFFANPKYEAYLGSTAASAIIVSKEVDNRHCNKPLIQTDNPYLSFVKVIELLGPKPVKPAPGIHSSALVADSARLGEGACISGHAVIEDDAVIGRNTAIFPFVYVGRGAVIGDDCVIYPNVTVRESVRIGNKVIIHSGTVVGSDGFGYTKDGAGHRKIPQTGIVVIEDDVEVGSNVSIDRATVGATIIKKGTKIDNLVQIAHNVLVGEHSIIVAQVGISGSTVLGKNVTLGGQAGLIGHVEIGENAVVGAQAGVISSVPEGTCVSGYPAKPHREAMKLQASVQHLPELYKLVRQLEKRVNKLEGTEDNEPEADDTG
jgi:UDP-3-O-[3-hydroxymyristoyl] glucosamine N-acyltransferase